MNTETEPSAAQKYTTLLAKFAVRSGIDVQVGQDVFVSGPLEARPLVLEIAKECYSAGCRFVSTTYSDTDLNHVRLKNSRDSFLSYYPSWFYEGLSKAYDDGTARIAVTGELAQDFSLDDLRKAADINRSHSIAYKPAGQKISDNKINWTIIPYPTLNWARRVYPGLDDEVALEKLWEDIARILRLDSPDPVSNWAQHNANLEQRRQKLQNMDLSELSFTSTSTNLRVGLLGGHKWCGGRTLFPNGSFGNTNIPTFEVFTCPDASRVDGHVTFTKPIVLPGKAITGVTAHFREGKLCDLEGASEDVEYFRTLTSTDEGASRLGEVALVPNSSPISKTDKTFYNTLFDENASCHIAFGQSFRRSYTALADEIIPDANQSSIHQDCMIGSADMNITGRSKSGEEFQVMHNGEFVI